MFPGVESSLCQTTSSSNEGDSESGEDVIEKLPFKLGKPEKV